jgi:hypothetical protein
MQNKEKIEMNGKQQIPVCTADAKRANTTNKTNYYEGWPRILIIF